MTLQDDARIVGLAVSVSDSKIFWSDLNLLRNGIYAADIMTGPVRLENVERIVSFGKLELILSFYENSDIRNTVT